MDTAFWHPFANMARVREHALTIVRGQGAVVWDDTGREYIDATGALWFCNVGHGRAELADAAAQQMRVLASYHAFGAFTNPRAEELAGRTTRRDRRIVRTSRAHRDACSG